MAKLIGTAMVGISLGTALLAVSIWSLPTGIYGGPSAMHILGISLGSGLLGTGVLAMLLAMTSSAIVSGVRDVVREQADADRVQRQKDAVRSA